MRKASVHANRLRPWVLRIAVLVAVVVWAAEMSGAAGPVQLLTSKPLAVVAVVLIGYGLTWIVERVWDVTWGSEATPKPLSRDTRPE